MRQTHGLTLFAALLVASEACAQDNQLTADIVFAAEHVVRVDIELPQKDWDTLRAQTRSFAKSLGKTAATSPFRYFKGHVTINGVRIENVGIRKKGFFGSLDRHRPSLKIKFDEFVKQSPIAGIDRLTLNNNKQDSSQVCAALALKLFRDAGLPASRCNHAKVSINGQSLGIYSNIESIRPPLLQRVFGDSSGHLFEGAGTDFIAEGLPRFQKKTRNTKLEPVAAVTEILAADEVDVGRLEAILDVEAFLKFWAIESLIGFWDGYTYGQNNYYLYQKPANSKLYFLPWGIDAAFVATMPAAPFIIKTKVVHTQAVLPNHLYRIPAIQKRYRAVLEGLLQSVWDEKAIYAEIDRIERLITGHLHPNQRRSPKALRKMRGFIKTRRRVMQRGLRRWPPKLQTGPRTLMCLERVGQATAKFSTTFGAKARSGTGEFELTLNGKRVAMRNVKTRATPGMGPTLDGGPSHPLLSITGERESDGATFTLALTVAVEEFRDSRGRSARVQGALVAGSLRILGADGIRLVCGEVEFEAAAMKDGAPVRGTVSVEVTTKTGGEMSPLKPK